MPKRLSHPLWRTKHNHTEFLANHDEKGSPEDKLRKARGVEPAHKPGPKPVTETIGASPRRLRAAADRGEISHQVANKWRRLARPQECPSGCRIHFGEQNTTIRNFLQTMTIKVRLRTNKIVHSDITLDIGHEAKAWGQQLGRRSSSIAQAYLQLAH